MSQEFVSIKGIRHGLLVTRHQGTWKELIDELKVRLEANPAFFKGGKLSLDVGGLQLNEADIRGLRSMLVRYDVALHAVVSTDEKTEAAAQALGLVIDLGLERRPPPASTLSPRDEITGGDAIVVRRTVRSGQSIRHSGHVVVIGDVNPGAEIVAGGHIIVWGKLRGTVHAGAGGDEEAVVCALDLTPTQLRIAGYITRSPEDRRRRPTPEMASVRDGQIVARPWK